MKEHKMECCETCFMYDKCKWGAETSGRNFNPKKKCEKWHMNEILLKVLKRGEIQ